MPRAHVLALIVAALAPAALAPPAAAEEVENPVYTSWAKHEVGTTAVFRSTSEAGGRKTESTTRTTLVELTDKKAVVEEVTTSDATGKVVESAPQRFTVRRMFPLLPGVKREGVGKPEGASEHGEEAVEVGGRRYAAQWYDSKGRTEAGPSITRTWMSDEVPGRLLRSVTQVPEAKKTTTLELVELKAP